MEELPAKAKEVMAGAESDYENWKEKVESVLQKAVFNHDTSTATIIYEYLKKKALDVGTIISNLERHIMPKAAEVMNVMLNGPSRPASSPIDTITSRPLAPNDQPYGKQDRPTVPAAGGFTGPRTFLAPSAPPPRPILPSQEWQTVGKKASFPSTQASQPPGQLSEEDGEGEEDEKDSRISDDGSSSESTQRIVPTKVFLLNLARSSDSQSIARYFSKFGPVVDVKIIRFSDGVSRGVGSVEFKSVETARKVLANPQETHMIDGRPVSCRPFRPKDPSEKNGPKPWERFQIFLGGIPSFYTEEQVRADLAGKVTVRDIRMRAERGYAYLDLASEKDVDCLLRLGRVKMGEKLVQCKLNEQRH
ncbi:hypothetical protein RvY_18992 [Ramazzottius varieornatus]|uniref:RRM domain-containing protein n=1 Tax=Ramazzottius varieornatus TaxID=947166 RepID=A0A1D1WAD1_RAMVA|nr:hypothetical protein RvY_18992 [Ramazzottius varieornatus]